MTAASPAVAPTRRIALNLGKLVTGKVAAGLVSLVYLAIATRSLGAEGYGVLDLVHGFATIVGTTLAFSGFHTMVHAGAEALERGSGAELRGLVRLMATIELGLGALAIGVAFAILPWVADLLHWSEPARRIGPLYVFAILGTVRTTPHGILQLAERFDWIAAHQVVMPATRLVGALVAFAFDAGLDVFLGIWLASALAEGVSMWVLGGLELRRMNLPPGCLSFAEVRALHPGLLRFAAATNLDLTLRDLAPKAAPLIVGAVLGPAAAGLFAVVQRASAVLTQPPQMLAQAGFPVIARLVASGDLAGVDRTVRRSAGLATVAALGLAGSMVVAGEPLLHLLGGADFTGGALLLALVAGGRAIAAGGPTLSAGLTALGRPRASVAAQVASNLLLLPALPWLLHRVGVLGVGLHVVAQSLVLVGMLGVSYRASVRLRG